MLESQLVAEGFMVWFLVFLTRSEHLMGWFTEVFFFFPCVTYSKVKYHTGITAVLKTAIMWCLFGVSYFLHHMFWKLLVLHSVSNTNSLSLCSVGLTCLTINLHVSIVMKECIQVSLCTWYSLLYIVCILFTSQFSKCFSNGDISWAPDDSWSPEQFSSCTHDSH